MTGFAFATLKGTGGGGRVGGGDGGGGGGGTAAQVGQQATLDADALEGDETTNAADKDGAVTLDTTGSKTLGVKQGRAVGAADGGGAISATAVTPGLDSEGNDHAGRPTCSVAVGHPQPFKCWKPTRAKMLAQYTPTEKLVLHAQMFSDETMRLGNSPTSVNLDLSGMSLPECIDAFGVIKRNIATAFGDAKRVYALKVVINCALILADTHAIQSYPSRFVLIADILNMFGDLVYMRTYKKCAYYPPGSSVAKDIPVDFTPDMVPHSAKETAKNWFFKTASIRLVIPRFYVGVALLRCNMFLDGNAFEMALVRLSGMLRGIGDPLVAIYMRCYLCRVAVQVAPAFKGADWLMIACHQTAEACFYDTLRTYRQVRCGTVQEQIAKNCCTVNNYLHLWVPALEWILQCVSYEEHDSIITTSIEMSDFPQLANAILTVFPPAHLSSRAAESKALRTLGLGAETDPRKLIKWATEYLAEFESLPSWMMMAAAYPWQLCRNINEYGAILDERRQKLRAEDLGASPALLIEWQVLIAELDAELSGRLHRLGEGGATAPQTVALHGGLQ